MTRISLLPEGSVSHEAAVRLLGDNYTYVHHKLISDVFLSTVNGETQFSVIPIENTIEGSVNLHMDWIVHEVDLPFQAEWVYPSIQNVIGRKEEIGGDWARVTKVLSHPVAMAQCTNFIREHLPHAELEHISSTAEAVRQVKLNPNQGWVAIGTLLGAKTHSLDVLAANVTDHDNNFTRFVLVGKQPLPHLVAAETKTTILVTLPEDYPGALHQVLSAFAWRRINLSRIESRPTKRKLGNYYFYIDIQMSLDSVLLQAAIGETEALGCQVRVLGSYPSFTFDELAKKAY
ncbi:prephenate dehydratase [Paenibacillus sp. 481]|uniref:prephenate dehydratase n=1 Tax=Paenibacillus sp. 481 TaxID=2835869 RepID=UPI001E456FF7|nr:prephenate dehydratase [Paenibacillus sp. 481]UHA74343.1 prephenate dehydratase [Paenibacillus sp. 481]